MPSPTPGTAARDPEAVLGYGDSLRGAGRAQGRQRPHGGYVLLRLLHELKDVFKGWLAAHYPMRADHVMSLVRQMREGRENGAEFGLRQRGTGVYADLLAQRVAKARGRLGLVGSLPPLSADRFRPPGQQGQLALF